MDEKRLWHEKDGNGIFLLARNLVTLVASMSRRGSTIYSGLETALKWPWNWIEMTLNSEMRV